MNLLNIPELGLWVFASDSDVMFLLLPVVFSIDVLLAIPSCSRREKLAVVCTFIYDHRTVARERSCVIRSYCIG